MDENDYYRQSKPPCNYKSKAVSIITNSIFKKLAASMLRVFFTEDRGNRFLQNTCTYIPNYMVSSQKTVISIFTVMKK
jgi:hypothetical protein